MADLPQKTPSSQPEQAPAKLTDKQAAFVREYTKDWNATQAAIRAGYSEDSAGNIGWENVRKPEIAEAIQQHIQEAKSAAVMSLEEALARLTAIARSSLAQQLREDASVPDPEKVAQMGQALRKVKWSADGGLEIEMVDPLKAMDELAKLQGWDKSGGGQGVTINNIIGVGEIRPYKRGEQGGGK